MNDAYYNQDQATRTAIEDNYISEQEREYEKRKQLLDKFLDGATRYNLEPLFRQVIEALVRGADSWEIIEKLLEMNKSLSDKTRKLIEQWPSHIPPKL